MEQFFVGLGIDIKTVFNLCRQLLSLFFWNITDALTTAIHNLHRVWIVFVFWFANKYQCLSNIYFFQQILIAVDKRMTDYFRVKRSFNFTVHSCLAFLFYF